MEPHTTTTEKILAAIETKHVRPRPKWYFIVRNILLWIPGLITTFLGAYTVSGVLYGVLHAHLENRLYTANSSQIASLIAIPVLWIVSFGIFSIVTISFLRKTKTGYRHPATQLLLLSIAGSVIIGILFYIVTSTSLAGPGSFYRYPTQHQQQNIWNDPDDGRISGVISAFHGTTVTLTDFHGVSWVVDASAVPTDENILLKTGNAIRVVGEVSGDHTFDACRILQWELFPAQTAPLRQPSNATHPPISCDSILAHFRQ